MVGGWGEVRYAMGREIIEFCTIYYIVDIHLFLLSIVCSCIHVYISPPDLRKDVCQLFCLEPCLPTFANEWINMQFPEIVCIKNS